jgi:hypothetical protein
MEDEMLPASRTLDGFALKSNERDGLAIEKLEAGVTLVATTQHSTYRLTVLDGARHLVRAEGGIFPEPTVVRLSGATFGGSTLKLGWILVGLRIEFGLGPRQITSSTVQSIAIESPSPLTVREECAA